MKCPDFFIIGAFKAGTTALYEYLRQHPQVYMPFHKEPMFFGDDLQPRYARMSEQEYLNLFEQARPDQRVGEASPWYLYSRTAAGEIAEFSPGAQIIVMLRNPVDVMHAQHSQLVFNQREDLTDFAEALSAEPARRRGERMPAGGLRAEAVFYRESVRFAEQLERYIDTFGRERVHVIVYDDFAADPRQAYRSVLTFLGMSTGFEPVFEVRNPNRRARSALLQRLAFRPPAPLRRAVPVLRRFPIVHSVREAVVGFNSAPERRAPMDPKLRRQLTAEFAPQVARLGQLIGRDLSAWSRPEA
jgi:hypothetical protein